MRQFLTINFVGTSILFHVAVLCLRVSQSICFIALAIPIYIHALLFSFLSLKSEEERSHVAHGGVGGGGGFYCFEFIQEGGKDICFIRYVNSKFTFIIFYDTLMYIS